MAKPYATLSKALQAQVVRWVHASFVFDDLDPYSCERSGGKRGRRLKKPSRAGRYSYGYDGDGRLLVSREGQFEYLHLWGDDNVRRLQFDRSNIDFARKHGAPADVRRAERLHAQALFTYRGGRLVRLEEKWPGKRPVISRYEYDREGRVSRVRISEPRHTDELTYDATGQLVRVVWRDPNGKGSERYRHAPRSDRLSLVLPEVEKKLLEVVPAVLAKARIRKPAYCLALTCNLEEAPHLLPPRLVVGLVEERDSRLRERGREYALDEIWRPDCMPGFDDPRVELRDRELLALSKRVNVAREDDRPVLRMLRRVAAALQRRGLGDVLRCEPDFIVYAVDFGDESGQQVARRVGPKASVRRLRRAGLL